jgi:hypothetical protein
VSPLIYAEVALRINSTSGNVCQEKTSWSNRSWKQWLEFFHIWLCKCRVYYGIFTDMCVIVRGIMDIEKVSRPTLYLYDGKRQPSLTQTSFVGHIPIEAKSFFMLHCVLLHIIHLDDLIEPKSMNIYTKRYCFCSSWNMVIYMELIPIFSHEIWE